MSRTAGRARRRRVRRRLSASVGLRLVYRDETLFGAMASGACERQMQTRLAVLHAYRRRHGLARLLREGEDVLARILPRCLEGVALASGRLNPRWLYPAPALVTPALLQVERDAGAVCARIRLDTAVAADLAPWLGDWEAGGAEPRDGGARRLWHALVEAGALVTTGAPATRGRRAGLRFVGHASVLLDDGRQRVLSDPFLPPRSRRYAPGWQPASVASLGRLDAVLVTHSHPDHYDPGTLLRLGADTPVYVPRVARESVLAVDMAMRLRQLGFRRVSEVLPGDSLRVGGTSIAVLPFHGEQPTTGERLHPEVRNEGVTFVVETPAGRVALLADAGVDESGDVVDVAARDRDERGPVSGVFCGFRGFALLPVHYAFSSVSRYLPFVPRHALGRRQRIMCGVDEFLDVAERWAAAWAVPYAAGGAPWFWRRGLGRDPDAAPADDAVADPLPADVVAAAARRRSAGRHRASPAVRVMRAGDAWPLRACTRSAAP